ncbi:MAG TPA: hypothetical protein VGM62_00095 [Chthoniobacterales bacterium]|jgi:hypothetical protein
MKDSERLLDKALTLAQGRPDPIPAELPFGMETAILAQWRNARAAKFTGMIPIFRWAAMIAIVLAMLSGAWNRDVFVQIADRFNPETSIVNSTFSDLD